MNPLIEELKQDFPLLIEAGFIAVKQLDETSAKRIFAAAEAISPGHTAPQIGLGYIELTKLQSEAAAKIFKKVLEVESDNHLASVFYGMALLLTKGKGPEGEKIVKEAMEKSSDPSVKNLGQIVLDWAKKDLSKRNTLPFS